MKKYNPFKLIGSYIGLILGLLIGISQIRIRPNPNLLPGMTGIASPTGAYLILPLMVLGFFVGYFINVGIRKIKSREKTNFSKNKEK